MNTRLKAILVIMLASGLLTAGCSPGTGQAPVIGKPAPEFQLESLDGQSVSLSSFEGQPVLINLWQVRCPPCRSEMPYMQQIYDEWHSRGLVLLTINIGESSAIIEEFMQSQGLSLPVLLDREGKVAQKYNIQFIPTTFLVDKDGIIQEKIIGAFQSKEQIEKKVSQMLP